MFNHLINILKYPVAIVVALWSLELFKIFWDIIQTIMANKEAYDPFFMGIALYLLMWFVLFRRRLGRLFMILEHEVTHTLFALVTFNKVYEIRANIIRGHMVHAKGGNWLILVAPYFFSLLGAIVIGLVHLSSPHYYPILTGALGYVVVHHIHTILVSISPRQPDLQEVGFPFAILFLPSANLLMLIALLTAIPTDEIYFSPVVDHLSAFSLYLFENLKEYVVNLL